MFINVIYLKHFLYSNKFIYLPYLDHVHSTVTKKKIKTFKSRYVMKLFLIDNKLWCAIRMQFYDCFCFLNLPLHNYFNKVSHSSVILRNGMRLFYF